MRYELYYWPEIQGRGEFVRLALEEAGVDYLDVARLPEESGMGVPALLRLLEQADRPPFAPPFLRAGELLLGQTANILLYLGERHGLAPRTDADRLWVLQLQLTVADFVAEVHDTHHPIASRLYYADQMPEARRRANHFTSDRLPRFLAYFERIVTCNRASSHHLVGAELTYADLSLFQVVEGVRYAFPRTMAHLEQSYPGVLAVHAMVAARPRIGAYLRSPRRMPFSQHGIFRHYPELDAA